MTLKCRFSNVGAVGGGGGGGGLTRYACFGSNSYSIISINLYIMACLLHSNFILKERNDKISREI